MEAFKKSNKLALFLAVLFSILFLVPLLYMFFTSFKTMAESISSANLLPQEWTLENYRELLFDTSNTPILRWLLNTAFVTLLGTTLVVMIDVLAAYSLARLHLPFKKVAVWTVILSMTIPGIVTLFPNFFLFKEFNLLDTYLPLVLIYTSSAIGVYMIYNFLKNFPNELEESAYIDGASQFRILKDIVLPNIKGPVATLSIMTFLVIYNDFLWPSLVVNSDEMKTVTVGVASLVQGQNFVNPGRMMASTVIATLPALVIFLFSNRFFVQSNRNVGIK